jgi:acetate kinase
MTEGGVILCVNGGSSSLKVAAFGASSDDQKIAEASVDRIGTAESRLRFKKDGQESARAIAAPDHRAALGVVLDVLHEAQVGDPSAVGHRVVHGGDAHIEPERVDAALLESLRGLAELAPLHMPPAIAAIEAVSAKLPGVAQVACFDTAFHATLPEIARRLPIPDRFPEVRRYGFHGLSYEYIVSTLGPRVPPRLIVAHLGNGASLAAIQGGRSIDTTMGFTPSGGIPMGTRAGDLDPGALVYLARKYGMDAGALEHLVDKESGLLAMGGASDMKELLDRRETDPRARFAVDAFSHAVRKVIGAYAAALAGVDLLVFTGGIGEHAAAVRGEACRGLECLGIVLDAKKNEGHEDTISAEASRCAVRVIPTDEDRVIARHVRRIVC